MQTNGFLCLFYFLKYSTLNSGHKLCITLYLYLLLQNNNVLLPFYFVCTKLFYINTVIYHKQNNLK